MRRVLRRLSVGGLPPAVPPSGACLTLGSRMPEGALPAIAGAPNTGAASLPLPGGNLRHYSGTRARSVGRTVCRESPGQWPTESPPAHGPWPRGRRWPVGRVPRVVGSVSTAWPGPSSGCPGSSWVVFRVAVAEAAGPWRESGRPRRLRPAPVGPGCDRLGEAPPAGAAPPRQTPTGARPRMAGARWEEHSASGRRVPPRWGPHPCPARPAGPGGPRPAGARATLARALAVPGQDAGGVRGVRSRHGPLLARRGVAPGSGRPLPSAPGEGRGSRGPGQWSGYRVAARRRCDGTGRPGERRGSPHGPGGGRAARRRPPWAQQPRCAPPRAPGGPVARRPGGRLGRGPRPFWAGVRGPPPRRRRLFASESGRARSPRGRRQRPRPDGWPSRAACGGVDRGHPAGAPGSRGRGPRRRARGRQRQRRWPPCGPPCRQRGGETAAALPAERVGVRGQHQVVLR
jgi:hypothetical protein